MKLLKTLTGLGTIGLVIGGIWWLTARPAKADWFDDSWLYRKSITFVNSGSAVSNQEVKLEIDTSTLISAKLQSSCQDARFTDAGGNVLKYYINVAGGAGIGCNDASSDFYVIMPNIPVGGNLIYFYYGNSSALAGTASGDFGLTQFTTGTLTTGSETQGIGPVAYWRFDEGYGTTTSDATVRKITATLAGSTLPTWQTDDQCISNKCLYFEGTVANNTVATAINNVKTVALWVRPSGISSAALIDLDGGTHKITISSGVISATGFTSPTIYVNGQTSTTLANNAWQLVEVTTGTSFNTTSSLTMGKSSSTFFKGFMDEVKFYPYTRTAAQVKSDYLSRGGSSGTGALLGASDQNSSALSSGVIEDWSMDVINPTSVNYGLTTQGGTGDSGNGGALLAQKITVTSTVTLQSLSFLVNNASGGLQLGVYNDSSGSPGTKLAETNTFTPTTGWNTQSTTTNPSMTPGDYWIAYEPQNDGLSFYLDNTGTYKFHGGNAYGSLPSSFGSVDDSGGSNWSFYATLNDPNSVIGKAGNYALTQNGSMSTTTGHFASAVSFDGSSKYLNSANTISGIDSVSFWVKPASTTDNFVNFATGVYISASSGTLSATGVTNPIFFVNNVQTNTITSGSWQLVTMTTTTPITANAFEIGRANGSYAANNTLIDEFRIYNRALSVNEVSQIYGWAPGPIAYWKFDDASGSSAVDSSTNAYTGTWNGTLGSQWSLGKIGGAGNFNGTDNYINVASTSNLQLGNKDFTVSTWVYPVGVAAFGSVELASKGSVGGAEFRLESLGTSGGWWINVGGAEGSLSATNLTNNQWQFITLTRSGNTVSIYYNGIFSASTTLTGSSTTSSDFLIGCLMNGVCNDIFPGKIDDLKVYTYVRSPKQIVQDMNGNHPVGGSPIGSQAMYYRLDEQNGTTANDSGYSNTSGTVSSATLWKLPNSCKVNGCLNISATTDNVSISDPAMFAPSMASMSASFWINPQTLTASRSIISKSNTNQETFKIETWSTASELKVSIASSVTTITDYYATQGLGLVANAWQHIMVVYDSNQPNAKRVQVYRNGVLAAGGVNGTIPGNFTDSTANLRIGQSQGATSALSTYIDEVKIYPYALNQSDVNIDMNNGSAVTLGGLMANTNTSVSNTTNDEGFGGVAPIGWWKFDDNTGTNAVDSSGNAYTGTLTATNWAPGKYGGALKLDGTTSYSTMSSEGANFSTNSYSVSAWINRTSIGGAQIIVDNRDGNNDGWGMLVNSSDFAQCAYNGGTATSTTTILPNTWYHIACSSNGSTLTIYLNGLPQGTGAIASSISETTNMRIGARSFTSPTTFFPGLIDDVRVYNYGRSQAQVAYDMNRGAPIVQYKFDECSGSTAHNTAPGTTGLTPGLDGTLTPGASGNTTVGTCNSGTNTEMWNNGTTGKYNSSVDLDGTDDYVEIADDSALRFDSSTQDFSIFAWVKRNTSGANQYIIDKLDAANDGWLLQFNSADTVTCKLNSTAITSTSTITDTNWHHIGCVVNRSGTGQIYIDGSANGPPVTTTSITMATTAVARIGAQSFAAITNYLDAQVDDLRIYNYVVSANQIKQIYNNGAIFFGPASGAP